MFVRYFVLLLLISLRCVTAEYLLDNISTALTNNPELESCVPLEFCELANKCGYECIRYEVITEDGYILILFNIPGDTEYPIFLQHGYLDSSNTWILRGHDSPAAFLHNNGYDLWFGNTRGNMYSRAHKTLDPDGLEFWDFTFHEMAMYDMPAMICFILEKTGQTKLQVIAHSQGTQIFIVLGVLKPKFALIIKIVVCFAPVAYLTYAQHPLFYLSYLAGGPLLSASIGFIGRGEFLRNSSVLSVLFRSACSQGLIGYAACGLGFTFVLFGPDPEQFEPEFERIVFGCYYPCGSSMKNTVHLAQIVTSRRFQQYDYGLGNWKRYGSSQPPVYDLSKVPFNLSLYVGKNDRLSAIEDVDRLRAELNENVIREYYVMPYEAWNHIDFIWGRFMKIYLFDPLLKTLKDNY